jgi:uncharacterized membrane protein YoaK (UPF0700 family)
MRLNPPRQVTWLLAVLLGILGILAHVATIDYVSDYAFWVVSLAFVLLALATVFRGL